MKNKVKLEKWKQSCPKDQMTVLLMALEGHISNLEERIVVDYHQLYNLIHELKLIKDYLPSEWD